MEISKQESDLTDETINRRVHQIDKQIEAHCASVRSELDNQVGPSYPAEAYLSVLEAHGSRTRGLLATVGHDLVNGRDEDSVIKVAALVEGWHAWSLVLDDDQDNAEVRRDEDTAHVAIQRSLWASHRAGSGNRVVAGNLATNGATAGLFRWIEEIDSLDIDSRQKNLITKILARTTCRAATGQNFDLINSGPKNTNDVYKINEQDIINAYASKTGQLLLGSLQMGMVVGGAEEPDLSRVEGYAINAGIAYQIADDLLLMDPETDDGKDSQNDITQGKMTLLIHSSLGFRSHSDHTDKKFLAERLGRGDITDDEYEHCTRIIRTSRAVGYCLNMVEDFVAEANSSLVNETGIHWDQSSVGFLSRMSKSIVKKARQTVG